MHFITPKPCGKVGRCLPTVRRLGRSRARGIKDGKGWWTGGLGRGKSFPVITLDTCPFAAQNEKYRSGIIVHSLALTYNAARALGAASSEGMFVTPRYFKVAPD